jgi:hypothetical protein
MKKLFERIEYIFCQQLLKMLFEGFKAHIKLRSKARSL